MKQYKKHFLHISKHIEALLHLPVVARGAAGLIKLATKKVTPCYPIQRENVVCVFFIIHM